MSHPPFPIKTISELATLLDITASNLWCLAKTTDKSYSSWKKPKISGGFRELTAPKPHLKAVQKKLHKLLFSNMISFRFSHYGIKRKSNVTNALEHNGYDVIFTFDLKSFFPSVRPERVKNALVNEFGCSAPLASIITRLVTVNYQLPQGAPTSTDIANIVTLRLQRRLYPLAKQWGIKKFTVYADDVTFSGDNIPNGFTYMVQNIVKEEGFKIHPFTRKGGIFSKSDEQIVTGINIAHGLTVGNMKKNWRAERYQNSLLFQEGKISMEEFNVSERRYNSRMGYSNFVKKSGQKIS